MAPTDGGPSCFVPKALGLSRAAQPRITRVHDDREASMCVIHVSSCNKNIRALFVTSVTGVHCTICWRQENMRLIAKGQIEVLAPTGLPGIPLGVLRLWTLSSFPF